MVLTVGRVRLLLMRAMESKVLLLVSLASWRRLLILSSCLLNMNL